MEKVQDLFNASAADCFILPPGEYEGPLLINRPCTVDGSQSTLWANQGPVVSIAAPGVTIRSLRVEVTCGQQTDSAIAMRTNDPRTVLEQVEVSGSMVGFASEAENWQLPNLINLGDFASGEENTFTVKLTAPAEAELISTVKDLRLTPSRLKPGENTILLTTDELRSNTILYGEIQVKTNVIRRIYLTGKALKDAPVHSAQLPASQGTVISLPVQVELPVEVVAPTVSASMVKQITRGQRLSIREMQSSRIKLMLEHQGMSRQMDIDGYCFLLSGSGKVLRDEDLVFFGNQEDAGHCVRCGDAQGRPMTMIDLPRVSPEVERIAVCYSIYGDNAMENFSAVKSPAVRIFDGGREVMRFDMQELSDVKTVVAVEVYRYKGEWKINFVGSGYRSGLKQLCEGYGVHVE